MQIEHIELDESNIAFNQAADFIRYTNNNVFLTGRAGTGKTTFLKYIRQTTEKKTVVLAPTGVAAVNAGGQTVHSFFHLSFGIYLPDDVRLREKAPKDDADRRIISDFFHYRQDKVELIKSLELLIIDEISMLRCDVLDVIDKLLRHFRNWDGEPFGGVQVLLIGDPFQLPPIANHEEWKILETFYDSPFFFSSRVIRQNPLLYIELKKIYRQKDRRFIELLNNIRTNTVNESDMALLTSRHLPAFQPDESSTYIILATHNRIVDDTNRTKLAQLPAEEKTFEAVVTGIFPDEIMPANRTLHLKEGAQVMFVKNNLPEYYNGQMGKIVQIIDNRMIVHSKNKDIPVGLVEWENIRYSWNRRKNKIEEEIIGTFVQYPLKLAWAITVHKSQGLTFENVIADVGAAFTHGQVYVALSRCTNLEGLALRTGIERKAIKTNPQALFYARNELSEEQLTQILEAAKAEYSAQTTFKPLPTAPDMPIDELFEQMNIHFNNTELLFVDMAGQLNALLENNTTSFAKHIRKLDWDNEEKIIFLFFCHLLINLDYALIELSDLEELFDKKRDYRKVRLSFINKTHPAFLSDFIHRKNEAYCLTKKAQDIFLSEILPETREPEMTVSEKQKPEINQLIDYQSISQRTLFYSVQEREQVASLIKLLDKKNFIEVQERLSAAGMRKGFACIFYGAPGTGKTETVYQIARQTERNIFAVNISEINSKWVGESEKNIKDVFDRYRKYVGQSKTAPILLFNEADGLFTKRADTGNGTNSAVVQMQNAMQNIILQEMENLDGIMIATTNLTQNLDDAFERRFLYKIEFHKPPTEARTKIWQTLIPLLKAEEAQELAESYDLSGGEMENIARKCTVETIISGLPLSLADLHRFCKEEKLLGKNRRVRIGF